MTLERRTTPDREAPELGDMMTRMLRALVRRAAAGELDALGELKRPGAPCAPRAACTIAWPLAS